MDSFLYQSTIYLLAAVFAVPIVARLGLGSVLGYLVAGIVIGPVAGLVGAETASVRDFAEFGVVMMLFLIGLELEPKALWAMRHRLLGMGGLQIVVTMMLVAFAGVGLGFTWQQSLTAGTILSLSSTAIVLQTLSEKRLINSPGGNSAFSVLLMQDIAVIPMLALLPLLAFAPLRRSTSEGAAGSNDAVQTARSLIESLPGWEVTLVTLGAVLAVVFAGLHLIPPMFRLVSAARLRELYTALALLIVLGIALLMSLVGLSPALGTFLAGVVLANSEFRHELESDIEPFKGLLLGLFFITVGAGIDFRIVLREPLPILGLTLGVMALKGVILFALAFVFRLRGRDGWLFTLGLAQAGEFGFVLTSFSVQQRVILPYMADRISLIIALSMLLTPLAFIIYERLPRRGAEHDAGEDADPIDERQPVLIAGIGRFGEAVNRLVTASGFPTTVLDNNLDSIEAIRTFGFKGFFGDPTRPDLLQAAGIASAAVLVVAIDDPDAALRLVSYARKVRPDIFIVARATDRIHVFRLYRAGADRIVREVFDSSLRAGRYVLEHMGLTEIEAREAERTLYRIDRHAMQELAEVWDPDIPVAQNKAYIERSRAMNRDTRTAILSLFDREDGDAA